MYVKAKCPHCEKVIYRELRLKGLREFPITEYRLIHCDPDEDGCGERFVIKVLLTAEIDVQGIEL